MFCLILNYIFLHFCNKIDFSYIFRVIYDTTLVIHYVFLNKLSQFITASCPRSYREEKRGYNGVDKKRG